MNYFTVGLQIGAGFALAYWPIAKVIERLMRTKKNRAWAQDFFSDAIVEALEKRTAKKASR